MLTDHWPIIGFTIQTALFSTLLILPGGIATAWILARRDWPGKSLVETLITLPLVMPPVATGLILLKLFSKNGPLGALDVVFTWKAVVLAMSVMSFPLLVRASRIAFEEVSPRLEAIARTLGANPWRVFFSITLPLASRGIIAGIILAFARALGEFGATILIAGNIPGRTSTLSLSIYQLIQFGRDGEAFFLVGVSALLAFIAVWSSERFFRKTIGRP